MEKRRYIFEIQEDDLPAYRDALYLTPDEVELLGGNDGVAVAMMGRYEDWKTAISVQPTSEEVEAEIVEDLEGQVAEATEEVVE